jgi:hypothetical protein
MLSIIFMDVKLLSLQGKNKLRVFQNKLLREREREEVTREWRTLHNEFCMCCSLNVVRMIILRTGWTEHVGCMRMRK